MDTSKLNASVTSINKLGFNQIWSGSAYEVQNEQLISTMTKLNECISDINYYDLILQKKDKYVELCAQLAKLYSSRASCASSHTKEQNESGCGTCASYTAEIVKKEAERKELRAEIIGMLSKFSGIDVEIAEPADLGAITDDVRILFDLDALVDVCKNGHLKGTSGRYGLFEMYNETDFEGNIIPGSGEKYVNEQIALIVSQCRNEREIAVNVGLLMTKLAADKGYYLTYENNGAQGGIDGWVNNLEGSKYTYHEKNAAGFDTSIIYDKKYNNITQMQEGMDCCAIVSYLLNVATASDPTAPNPTGFAWEGVGGLDNYGEQVTSSQVKPGDIFIAPSEENPKGHTGMVAAINEDPNKPGYGTITIIESGGIKNALSVNVYTYTPGPDGKIMMNSKVTTLRNYDSVYSGKEVSE